MSIGMVKNVSLGSRVSAPRGPFLDKAPGRDRARRQIWFGVVIGSVSDNIWEVRYDNGEVRHEKSTQLKHHAASAGREPLLPLSPACLPEQRPGRIGLDIVPEGLPAPVVLSASPLPGPAHDSVPVVPCSAPQAQRQSIGSSGPSAPQTTPSGGTAPSIPSQNPDDADDEDISAPDAATSDDEENISLDEHARVRAEAKEILAKEIGVTVQRKDAQGQAVTWTVVSTVEERPPTMSQPSIFGLKEGLPENESGEVDLLKLWLMLYPGDPGEHITNLNAAGLLKDARFKAVTLHEWLTFWGLIIGARQYSEKGEKLWNSKPVGLRGAPDFGAYMKEWRFAEIRRLVPSICPHRELQPWARFEPMIAAFNQNRASTILRHGDSTMDESMSAWQPRKDKLGGLPNISFIKRKPRPLGSEFKTVCDTETGAMVFMEIQKGAKAMKEATHAHRLGVTAACTRRLAEQCEPGACVMGDSWFGSVKV